MAKREAAPMHYLVPVERLHEAVLAALRERPRWTLRDDAGPGGTVRFNTGLSLWSWSGQDMAAVTAAAADGASTLTISGQVAQRGLGSMQVVSWGEAGRIATKLTEAVDARLGVGAQPLT